MSRPRYASTMVLLRPDESGGFAVLLTRRPPQMRFLGGYYVFPGGTVHPGDYSARVLEICRQLSGDDARRILGDRREPEQALAGCPIWKFKCLYPSVSLIDNHLGKLSRNRVGRCGD